jgi:hypothetical protein
MELYTPIESKVFNMGVGGVSVGWVSEWGVQAKRRKVFFYSVPRRSAKFKNVKFDSFRYVIILNPSFCPDEFLSDLKKVIGR